MEKRLLKDIMKKRGVSAHCLARLTGIFEPYLYLALWGVREFVLNEIVQIKVALELSEQETAKIFFGKKVS